MPSIRVPTGWPAVAGVLAAMFLAPPVTGTARAQGRAAPQADCPRWHGATLADALQGKIPGVQVTVTGGAVGGTGFLRVRGVNNVGSNEPLIFVDNIRVNSSWSRGYRGMHSAPLFDFVDVTQVERIEVLRGPAATLQYGDGAANGVILIYTRRGSEAAEGDLRPCEDAGAGSP